MQQDADGVSSRKSPLELPPDMRQFLRVLYFSLLRVGPDDWREPCVRCGMTGQAHTLRGLHAFKRKSLQ